MSVKTAALLVHMLAQYAIDTVGPDGTMVRVSAEDAPLSRAALITRIAEAAMEQAGVEQ